MEREGFCYPKRDQCFAHRFVRLLHKSCAIQEIGLDGFALLTIVAHTEDAIRYKGPVGFWNQTLLEILGMAKWDQLSKARQKCIDGGWLKYHGDGKRTPGQYFVTIPETYLQLDDGPIDHQYTLVNPETRYKQGYDDGYKAGYDAGYKAGDVQRDVQGEPFNPVPCIPDPLNTHAEDLFGECHVPESLDETDIAEIKRFVRCANENHFMPYPPGSEQMQSVLTMAARKKREGYDIPEICDSLVMARAKNFRVYDKTAKKEKPADQDKTFLAMVKVAMTRGGDTDGEREWRKDPKNVPREWHMALRATNLNWEKLKNENPFERKRNAELILEALADAKAKLMLENAS